MATKRKTETPGDDKAKKPQKQGAKRTSKKLHYQVYLSSGREETNRGRRMRRHLRAHPNDSAGLAEYRRQFGPMNDTPTERGKRRIRRAIAREVRYVGER